MTETGSCLNTNQNKREKNNPVTSWAVSGCCRSSATMVSGRCLKRFWHSDLNPMVYSSFVEKTAHVFSGWRPTWKNSAEFRYQAWWIGCRHRGCDSTLKEGGWNLIKPFYISGLTWGRSLFPLERPSGAASVLEASVCWHWQTSPRIDYMWLILSGNLHKLNSLAASTSCEPVRKARRCPVKTRPIMLRKTYWRCLTVFLWVTFCMAKTEWIFFFHIYLINKSPQSIEFWVPDSILKTGLGTN